MRLLQLIGLFLSLAASVRAQEPSDWMKGLPDNASLAHLSIPGTHDSAALHGGAYGQCQSMTLTEQLGAGVRFLDIRCRHIQDRFQIHHGMIDQRITFAEVRDQCQAFLKSHPSECIVMSIKEEYSAKENTRKFEETLASYLKEHETFWFQKNAKPKLGDVRGKVVVVTRRKGVAGVAWKSLKIQDRFKVSGSAAMAQKWIYVKKHLEAAKAGEEGDWYINFASGSGLLSPPHVVSKEINAKLSAHLKKLAPQRLGTMLLDFPSKELIKQIYQFNFTKPEALPAHQHADSEDHQSDAKNAGQGGVRK